MPPRPTMGHRNRVRVEFGLAPDVAEAVYTYAKAQGLSLSEAGTRLLNHALTEAADGSHLRHAPRAGMGGNLDAE